MDTTTDSPITDIQPYSPEWWNLRHGCFTGSEFFKLVGEPRSKAAKEDGELSDTALTYILEKVHEKLTGLTKMGIDNFATQWGVEHEPLAAKWYAKLTGNTLIDPTLCFHSTLEGFSCTPDKFVGEDGLCEIKCPANGANHLKHCFITTNEYFKKEHPDKYWQVMVQMNITGRKWCDFVSFDPRINSDMGMFIYRVEYSETEGKFIEDKLKKAREIYNEYLTLFSK